MNILFRSDAGPIEGFTSTNFRVAISDDGVGELIGEPDVVDQIQGQVIVSVDGVDVFAWVLEDRTATSDDNDEVVVAGRGNAARLERSIILPAGYPTFATRARSESGAPFAILASLIGEAQGRGRLAGLTPSWTSTLDSNGQPWEQNVTLSLEAGADLRALLDEVAEIEGAEWIVRPDGTFDAEREFGVDRSSEVVLFFGRDQLSLGRIESNREQRQTLYLSTSTGVSEVENAYVDDELGEVWVDGEDYRDEPTRDAVAQRLLESASLPQLEVEVVVSADCGIFDTFNVGDLVSLDSGEGTLETVRVVGATVTVTDQVDVELTLVSEVKIRQRRIDEAIRARADVQPGVSAATQRRTGLTPADKLESGALQFDTTIESANYEASVAGWRIDGDGNAEFNDATFRGDLQSDNYVPGESGWFLDREGFFEAEEGLFRGDIFGSTIVGSTFSTAPEDVFEYRILLRQLANVGEMVFFDDGGQEFGALRGVPFPGFTTAVQLTSQDGLLVFAQGQLQLTSQDWTIGIDGDANLRTVVTSSNAQVGAQLDVIGGATVGDGFSVLSGQTSVLGNLFVASTTSMANNLSVIGTTSSTFFVGDGSGLTNLPTPSLPSNPTFDVVDANQYRFRSGAAFPRLDRSGSNIQIRTAGSVRSKGDAGFFIEDGLTNLSVSSNVFVAATGRIFRAVSRRDTKTSIEYGQLDGVLDLQPAFFFPVVVDGEPSPVTRQYGLIAEDVEETGLTELVGYSAEGSPLSVNYDRVGVALIPYVREMRDRIEKLEEVIRER